MDEFDRYAFMLDFDITRSTCGGRTGRYASEVTQRAYMVWADQQRQLKALLERVAMLDARDPPNIYTEHMGLTALSPKLIKDGFDWRDNRINEFLAAASQASFCLREKLPNDVDAKLSVRMLEDARRACTNRPPLEANQEQKHE